MDSVNTSLQALLNLQRRERGILPNAVLTLASDWRANANTNRVSLLGKGQLDQHLKGTREPPSLANPLEKVLSTVSDEKKRASLAPYKDHPDGVGGCCRWQNSQLVTDVHCSTERLATFTEDAESADFN